MKNYLNLLLIAGVAVNLASANASAVLADNFQADAFQRKSDKSKKSDDNGDWDDDDDAPAKRIPKEDPNSPFLIEPYVFSLRGEKIGVAWSYEAKARPQEAALSLTTAAGTQDVKPLVDHDLYVATLPIPKCDFGSEISYEVTGMKRPLRIENVPCEGTARFSFMADTQEGTEFAHQFAIQSARYNGAGLLIAGDLVQHGNNYNDWIAFFEAMHPMIATHVLFPGIGNHEYKKDKKVPFWKYFFRNEAENAYYSFNIGEAKIITINSCFEDDPSTRFKQLAWLDAELAKPARWRIIYFHHPAYSKGVVNNEYYPKREYAILQKDYLPLFEKYKVDLVLNGHTHIFERSIVHGIQYLTTGAAGGKMGIYGAKNPYSIMDAKIRTMVELEVSHGALRAVTTSIEGQMIDEFTIPKPVDINLTQQDLRSTPVAPNNNHDQEVPVL